MTVDQTGTTGPGQSPGPDLGYALVGAAVATGDRVIDLAGRTAGSVRGAGGALARRASPLVPAMLRRRAAGLVCRLDAEGRGAVAGGTEVLARLASGMSDRLARDPNVVRLVERLAQQVQAPVVDAVLPEVLDRLADDSEQVRAIVHGQSRGMVEELATTVRTRAATGDDAVERAIGRVLRRRSTLRDPVGAAPRVVDASPRGAAPGQA